MDGAEACLANREEDLNFTEEKVMSLYINGVEFQEDFSHRGSCFFVDKQEKKIVCSLDISFKGSRYEEENISPAICINGFKVHVKDLKQLKNKSFRVYNIIHAAIREDSFYIYESEPLINYKVRIVDFVEGDRIRVQIKGKAIFDGYSKPSQKVKFMIDSVLPIIEDVNDWKKFEEN